MVMDASVASKTMKCTIYQFATLQGKGGMNVDFGEDERRASFALD